MGECLGKPLIIGSKKLTVHIKKNCIFESILIEGRDGQLRSWRATVLQSLTSTLIKHPNKQINDFRITKETSRQVNMHQG